MPYNGYERHKINVKFPKEKQMDATIPEPRRGLTFDDVWAALMENREQMKETDRQIKETDRQMKETDRRSEKLEKIYNERLEENRKWLDEAKKALAEAGKLIAENGKQIGGLHRSFGELAEHLVAPNIAERFNELGFHFESISSGNFKIYNKDMTIRTEVDILLENSENIIAVEVKTKPVEKDIEHHIKRLEILREFRNKHNDPRKILGAIAGAIFYKDVKQAVLEAGLYVLEQSGDTMKIETPEDSVLREW